MIAPHHIDLIEDASVTVMARLTLRSTGVAIEGTSLSTSDVSSVLHYVYDYADPTSPQAVSGHNGVTLTTSDVVLSALQGWHVDSVGHNFRYTVAATAFPTGNNPYLIVETVTLTNGGVGQLLFEGITHPVGTSSS